MALDFTEEDDQLVVQYVTAVLHGFKDGALGFEETIGALVDGIDLIAKGDPSYRIYMKTSLDGK